MGETGHEIVMVYDGAFVDRALYDRPVIDGAEDDGDSVSGRVGRTGGL